MAIDAPTVFVFFGNVNWTADDLAPLVDDWEGTGETIMNRVFNFEALDADGNQLVYQSQIFDTSSIPVDPAWASVNVTAVEVTSVSGAPPDPPSRSYDGETSETTHYVIPGPDPEPEGPIGGYVRHRDRMVQESVFDDIRDTLIACRWMAGTTSHEVWNPYPDPSNPTYEIVTTSALDVLQLVDQHPITLIDYFPETEDDDKATVGTTKSKTAPNTFALDNGTMGEATQRELGSSAQFVPYTFNMAFFAASDAMAQAVFNDLRDRFAGRLVRNDSVSLWNYNSEDDRPVVGMDVERFSYRLNTELATPANVHLYFGELLILDEVD